MRPPESYVAILDVGHGNCTTIVHASSVIAIDAGPKNTLPEYLYSVNIKHIDLVLLSHADMDHIGGLIGLLACQEFTIGSIRCNSDALKDSAIWDDLLYELSHNAANGQINFSISLTSSDSGKFEFDGLNIEVLGPSPYLAGKGPGSKYRGGGKVDSNSISAVLRIVFRGHPVVVLTGDLDDIGLRDLLEYHSAFPAPLLVFPHHGGHVGTASSLEPFTKTLCQLVNPQVVLFSTRRSESYPQPRHVATIRAWKPDTIVMCTQLSKQCAALLPTARPVHLVDTYARGLEDLSCCAGTIQFDLVAEKLMPAPSAHQEFVTLFAPSALCRTREQHD